MKSKAGQTLEECLSECSHIAYSLLVLGSANYANHKHIAQLSGNAEKYISTSQMYYSVCICNLCIVQCTANTYHYNVKLNLKCKTFVKIHRAELGGLLSIIYTFGDTHMIRILKYSWGCIISECYKCDILSIHSICYVFLCYLL